MREGTVLLVEDNPDDEELTLRARKLANLVNSPVVARDGREALDYLFAEGAHAGRDVEDVPAVVLFDLKLPRLGGFDVLQRMRSEPVTRLIPVVVLTSSSEEEDMLRSYAFGANSYVRKPVEFAAFAKAVAQLGMYWVLLNEPPPRKG
jgi:two-component system, response regulator